MLPWRPLGMLALGLSVIYLFIRMHGDGYDYPIKVAEHNAKLEFPRLPDRTYIEISGNVYHDPFRDSWQGYLRHNTTGDGGDNKDIKEDPRSHHRQKIMAGWQMRSKQNKEGIEEDESWVWMTNIWHEGNECGPGTL